MPPSCQPLTAAPLIGGTSTLLLQVVSRGLLSCSTPAWTQACLEGATKLSHTSRSLGSFRMVPTSATRPGLRTGVQPLLQDRTGRPKLSGQALEGAGSPQPTWGAMKYLSTHPKSRGPSGSSLWHQNITRVDLLWLAAIFLWRLALVGRILCLMPMSVSISKSVTML